VAPKDEQYFNTIIIARSHRYRSPLIDYSFLNGYRNKLFIGVQEEYDDMKKVLPDLEFKPVNDFLEMATIINSCRLFIGNQSFPFSLAEALKVNRLLEVYYKAPNVVVEGKGANDFIYQPQFEYAVKRLLE
jgi:ADP-heptose:LPS heptosyltransferase